MIRFSTLTRKKIHIFVMSLYVAVLVGSAMHVHGPDYNPLGNPEYRTPYSGESAHHGSTSYSACYIVAFAGTSTLELSPFQAGALVEKVFIAPFGSIGEIRLTLTGTNPLRGPPAV